MALQIRPVHHTRWGFTCTLLDLLRRLKMVLHEAEEEPEPRTGFGDIRQE
jgi:hypothetical protein